VSACCRFIEACGGRAGSSVGVEGESDGAGVWSVSSAVAGAAGCGSSSVSAAG